MGAEVLEFHFTDSREGKSFRDHKVSLTQQEVQELCGQLARIEAMKGDGVKRPGRAPAPTRRHAAFIISPLVRIDRKASADHTVIEVSGRDRMGLLYEIARQLADSSISIRSAHVGAYGERVHDVFYVEMLKGGTMPEELDAPLTERLVEVLRSHAPNAPRIPAHTLARAPASFNR
jgi:UTP:GlnB (protein PII) uridylyltransferase